MLLCNIKNQSSVTNENPKNHTPHRQTVTIRFFQFSDAICRTVIYHANKT